MLATVALVLFAITVVANDFYYFPRPIPVEVI